MKKMKLYLLIAGVFFASVSVIAGPDKTDKTKDSTPSEVPSTMYVFRTHLLALQPYLISEEAFTNPKNEKEVLKHLEALATFAKDLKNHDRLKTQGFEVSAMQMQEHLNKTYQIYKGGNRSFAWWLVRSSVYGCNTCHTQVAYKQAPTLQLDEGSISGSAFDQGEFWYTVRQYNRAWMFYHSVISRFGMDKTTEQELKASLRRILSICLRIDRSPKKALDVLTIAKDHPQISKDLKGKIDGWITELKAISNSNFPDPTTASAKQIEDYTSGKSLKNDEPTSIFISGILLDFVNQHPKKVTAGILYQLALSLEVTEKDLFFTSSDNYFKQCIEKFSTSPVAKKCFDGLKEKWTDGFTGSSGTNLPEDYKLELDRLEKLKNKAH